MTDEVDPTLKCYYEEIPEAKYSLVRIDKKV